MLVPVLGAAMEAAARGGARPLLTVAAGAASIACGGVALGFATLAGFDAARAAWGEIDAALVVAAVYAGAAAAIWAATMLARRWTGARTASEPDASAALLRLLEGGGRESAALAEILKAGRELSPLPMVALALAGGLAAGRAAPR